MATLTRSGPIWVLTSTDEERTIGKAAGLRWHGGNCYPGCAACAAGVGRLWWTADRTAAARLIQYADADTRAGLEAVTADLAASRAAAPVPAAADVAIPVPAGLALLPFQAAGIQYAIRRPRTLIADEMGLGKTVQALGVVNADPTMARVLVVCPATLRLNWIREAGRWLTVQRPAVLVDDDAPAIPAGPVLVVVGYERARRPACLAALRAGAWDIVVVDECHRCKDPKAAQTKAVVGSARTKSADAVPGLIDGAKRVLMLTGTPLVNRPIELWTVAHACAPAEFPNFWGFAKRYANAHETKYGWDMTGASHLDELQDKLRAACMVRRLKKDVLIDLPPKRRQIIELPANGAARAVAAETKAWDERESTLDALREQADAAHASGDRDAYEAAVERLRAAGKVAFEEMARARHDVAVAKAPRVAEHVLNLLETEDKIIVMGHHHEVLDAIRDALVAAEIPVIGIDGRTPMEDRQAACDAFQAEGGPRVFVGGIQAAGVGITLTRARVVVFAELDWVPGNVTQAEDRAHRIGQTDTVLIQHVVLDGSLDARMAKILVAKQAVADAALDDARRAVLAEPMMPAPRRTGESRPDKYLPATPEDRAAVLAALRTIAGTCDGARARDGAGFSGADAEIGHKLAGLAALTDGQVWLAAKLGNRYRAQLPADLVVQIAAYRARYSS